MKVTSGEANVNGTRLYYEIGGDGPAIVLVHGFTLDTRMWDDQFEPFAASHRVLRYDMRGFGRSAAIDGSPYDPCLDLAELMDHVGLDSAALIGLSMGGAVIIDFALTHPHKTTALVAADSALTGFDWPNGRPSASPVATVQTAGLEAGKQFWIESELFRPAARNRGVSSRLKAMVDDYNGWHWSNENPQIVPAQPTIACLDRIACPTLVVIGEHDAEDFQTIAELLAAGVPGARKVVIADAGHMSNMEQPAAFNRAVLEFLG